MRRMWREGYRRSPRISALEAWKAQPTRPPVGQSRSIANGNGTSASVRIEKQKEHKKVGNGEGPASRTRAKKKRKLKPLQDVASSPSPQQDLTKSDVHDGRQLTCEDHTSDSEYEHIVQGIDGPKHEDQAPYPDQPCCVPSSSWMPEKRILELIIDILQRRDTYEIFAEPVNPNEVEDYYEIIEEPMDFGTMRAKLHEGMYKSLEQFEHDVFLISRNAMHFNSSATIYFRQARAIEKLAEKVFNVLKTDPENFESEFSETRRRSGRRPQAEARCSTYSSSHRLATNSRSSSMKLDVSSKPMPCSMSVPSNLRRPIRINSWSSGTTTHSDERDQRVLFVTGDGRRSSCSEADRRSTYKPWMPFVNENSIVSTIYGNSKLLMHVNQQDTGYRESLMLFVKDLGPTAQMIAKRKLNGWSTDATNFLSPGLNSWPKVPNFQNCVASTSAEWTPTNLGTAPALKNSQNLSGNARMEMFDGVKGERAYTDNKMGMHGTPVELAPNSNGKHTFGAVRGEPHSGDWMDVVGVSMTGKFQQNQNGGIQLCSHLLTANADNLNFSPAGINNTDNKSRAMKLEKSKMDCNSHLLDSVFEDSQSNAMECRFGDNYSFASSSSSWPQQMTMISTFDQTIGSAHDRSSQYLSSNDQAIATQTDEIGGSSETCRVLKSSEPQTPVSQFIFDLPFLKTRLDQINSSAQDKFLQQSLGSKKPFLDRMSRTYNNNHPRSSMDTQLTNLALQL